MTADLEDDVSLEQLFELHRDSILEELAGAGPARVESYDAASQTASLKPVVRRGIPRADGTIARVELPIVHRVPVIWPRSGSYFLHMPLAAGDYVLLVACERDWSRWRQTGEVSDPTDVRKHHLAHAMAIPGVYPRSGALADRPTDAMVIGRQGSPSATVRIQDDGKIVLDAGDIRLGSAAAAAFAAHAGNVDAHLTAISADLIAIASAAMTTAVNYGSAAKTALDASNPVASTKVRVE